MNRCYSLLTVKAIDADARTFHGIASTIEPDRQGDIVEPTGMVAHLPVPLLWQHDPKQPIGEVIRANVFADRVEIDAKLARMSEPGPLRDRLDTAWQSIKAGLVKGLSIGFRALDARPTETGNRFLMWELLELSAVTIPANAGAGILAVKTFAQRNPRRPDGSYALIR